MIQFCVYKCVDEVNILSYTSIYDEFEKLVPLQLQVSGWLDSRI